MVSITIITYPRGFEPLFLGLSSAKVIEIDFSILITKDLITINFWRGTQVGLRGLFANQLDGKTCVGSNPIPSFKILFFIWWNQNTHGTVPLGHSC